MNVSGPARPFQAAVIQHPPVFLNLQASLEKACALIEQAAGQGARVIVFPETWLPGYPVWLDYAPAAALWDHPPAKALQTRIPRPRSIAAGIISRSSSRPTSE